MSDAQHEDSLSSSEGDVETADEEEMSDAQFFKILFILVGIVVCWFISIKALLNFLAIVFLLAWIGIIFSFEDLNVAIAAFVSLILLGIWGIFGGDSES